MDSPQLLGRSDISEIVTKSSVMASLNVWIVRDGLCLPKEKEEAQRSGTASRAEHIGFAHQARRVFKRRLCEVSTPALNL